MSGGPVVLIIDDEIQIRRFLRVTLETNGYEVHEADNGTDGLRAAGTLRPDAILLDWGLPDILGIDVLRRLRGWTNTPVIMLTVRDSDADKVLALDAGADDYLTKPFSTPELLARLRVARRHILPMAEDEVFRVKDLSVDLTRRVVLRGEEPLKLTPTEYALLRMLVSNAGKAVTHTQLLREVWGPEYMDEIHYLRVYMAQLRNKIEADPSRPELLLTEPGVGYRLITDDMRHMP
jgi:two-component system KDP operon response regulator KdpE